MPGTIVTAAQVAAPFIRELKAAVAASDVEPPLLVGFLANSDPAAKKYAEWTGRTCHDTGVRFELRECDRNDLEDRLLDANRDPLVHGIMIYYPVFGGTRDQYLQNSVSVKKDVEGLCHTYRYNMYHNIRFLDEEQKFKCIIPCTPLALIKILEHVGAYNPILPYGERLHGRTVAVFNRSEVVGRPLAALLANDGARVLSIDEYGVVEFHRGAGLRLRHHEAVDRPDLNAEAAARTADIVVTGVPGAAGFRLPAQWLRDGCVLVNFASARNFDEDEVRATASVVVPAVGKVTVAMLLRNLLRLHDYQRLGGVLPAGSAL